MAAKLLKQLKDRLTFWNIPIEAYIASRYIRFNIRQSIIIMLAVGMGVSIIIFIPSVNLSFFDYFLRKTVQNSAHIEVTRELKTRDRNKTVMSLLFEPQKQLVLMNDQSLTRFRNITAYQGLTQELFHFPGVVEAAPHISKPVIIVRGGYSRGVDLQGIVPEKEKQISDIASVVMEGNLDTLSSNEVFLGYLLAEELGVKIGNRVQIVTPNGRKSFKVAGLTNSGMRPKDLGQVLTTLEGAQNALGMKNEVTGIGLKIKNIFEAEALSQLIQKTLPVKAQSWMENSRTILEQISNFRVIIGFISFMIVMAAASSITSVLIMVVASKSKEIGILKAMGTTPGEIMRLFVIQAVFLSILGAGAGILGGLFFIAVYNFSPISRAETFLGVGREPVTLNMEYTIYAVCYAMGSSILASLIPAWRAGKLDPVKAINQ